MVRLADYPMVHIHTSPLTPVRMLILGSIICSGQLWPTSFERTVKPTEESRLNCTGEYT